MTILRAEVFWGSDPAGTAIDGMTVAVTDTASPAWADTRPFGSREKIATFEVFGGPAYVAIGKNPDPTAEPRRLLRPGLKVQAEISDGDRMSAIAAADVAA